MENYSFKKIRVLVGDPNREIRDGIRGGLYEHGFRYIVVTDRMSVAYEAAANNNIDLLICDTELPGGNLFDLTFRIRHHELGDNPFVVVTALVSLPTPPVVKKVFDSGCDDLVPKPISTGHLFERVMNLTRNRKRFVVTSDYIGPNRRAGPRPGTQQVPLIEVPNPLKAKAVDDISAEDLQRDIDEAAKVLNQQKMERHAYQIAYLVRRIVPRYEDDAVDETVIPHLDRLLFVAEDISRRLQGTPHEHVGDLCLSMVDVVKSVRGTPLAPDAKDISLMPALAQAIKCAFEPRDEVAGLARDISQSVNRRAGADPRRRVA